MATTKSTSKTYVADAAQKYLNANPDIKAEYDQFRAKEPARWTPESYATYHYSNYGKNETWRPGADGLAANIKNIAQQIMDQGLSSQWKGEGKGSAQANAEDMAAIMTAVGITDIKDFGTITKTADAAVIPQYERTVTGYDNEYNEIIESKIVGYTDQDGNPVDPKLVKSELAQVGSGDNTSYETVYVAPVGKQEVFGNKLTGQEVASTYGERQTGNAFGGTFDGSGNTGYRVKFSDDGTPYFFTTKATSNDLAILLQDIGPIGNILIAVATGGLTIPQQIAAKFAIDMFSGVEPKDALKRAAVSYVSAAIPSTDFMKDANKYLATVDATGTLTKVFTGTVVGATTGLLTGQDLLTAALAGAKSGGIGGVADIIMNNMDLSGLTKNQKSALRTTISGTLSGKPLEQNLMNAVTSLASSTAQEAIADNKKYAPLLQEDIDELSEAEKAAYDADGTRGLLDYRRAQKTKTTTSDAGTPGTGGVQVAGAGTGTASDAGTGVFTVGDVKGRPIYLEDSRAADLQIPFGYRILSSSESDTKPTGSFFDATTNAWLAPSATLTGNDQINADIDLFKGAVGDLDAFAKTTPGTEDDEMAAFLRSIGIYSVDELTSGLSNQDILDQINYRDDTVVVTAPGTTTPVTPPGTVTAGGGTTTKTPDTVIVTSCPDGQVRNAAGKCVDIDCGDGKYWDPVTKKCELKAPATVTPSTGTDTKTPDTVTVTACPDGFTRNAAGECKPIECGTGKHWDPVTKKCELDAVIPPVTVKCGANEEKNAAGDCVPKCATGFERGPDGMTCMLKPCGEGYVRGNDGITCVKKPDTPLVCKPDEKLSADGKSCIANVVVEACGTGTERHPNGKDCIDICKPGYERGPDGITCVKIPDELTPCQPGYKRGPDGISCVKDDTVVVNTCPEGFVRNAAGECKPIDCGVGNHWNPILNKCEADAVVTPEPCKPGFKRGPDGITCVKDDEVVITTCGTGKELGPDGKTCIDICKPGYVRGLDGITCVKEDDTVVIKDCLPGYKRGSDGISCVKDETVVVTTCGPGKELGPDGKTCVYICAPGYKRGTDGRSCVKDDTVTITTCGPGKERNAKGDCVNINCGIGRHWDLILDKCVDDTKIIDKTCLLPNQQWDEAQGKCVDKPVTPPVVKPPVVVPPVKPTTPVTNVTNVFSSSGAAPVDTTSPIYAKGMSDFNLFATLEDLLGEKPAKKDTQQSQQDTKMATGGYLDSLLAEQITVDDLLKLLR